jgi:hypothetical protein
MSTSVSEPVPELIHRACGGWLAVSPPEARFLIGVIAVAEMEALNMYSKGLEGLVGYCPAHQYGSSVGLSGESQSLVACGVKYIIGNIFLDRFQTDPPP